MAAKLPMSAIADLLGGLARIAKKKAELDPLETIVVNNCFSLLLEIAELEEEYDVAQYLREQLKAVEGIKK